MTKEQLKKSLRIAMANEGVNQRGLSKLSGVNEVTISNAMNGKSFPSTKTLAKIAAGLNISYSQLIAGGVENEL
jgi:transcriptional regulator with XRE-family HTH domain